MENKTVPPTLKNPNVLQQSPEGVQVTSSLPPPLPSSSPRPKKIILVIAGIFAVILVLGIGSFIYLGQQGNSAGNPITPAIPSDILTPSDTSYPTPTAISKIKLSLIKGQKILIPNSDVSLTFIGADISNPECFDCTSTTDILAEQGNRENTLQFLCGGIAGDCIDIVTAFGYKIELGETSDSSIIVYVEKQ